MSTAVTTPAATPVVRERTEPPRIGFPTILGVELRKMFDTRSGFWLMTSIVILSVIATGAVIVFAPDSAITYQTFASAVGIPMSVILPIIAILSVTSEWSQRGALTTFTLVPSRTRVIGAKALLTVAVGAAGIVVALAVGALGNLLGAAITGADLTWDVGWAGLAQVVLATELVMVMGFVLGVLIRNSPGAIVGYFAWYFVLPGISQALQAANQWWHTHAVWFDLAQNINNLYDNTFTAEEWLHLGVTVVIWIAAPLALGLRLALRREIK